MNDWKNHEYTVKYVYRKVYKWWTVLEKHNCPNDEKNHEYGCQRVKIHCCRYQRILLITPSSGQISLLTPLVYVHVALTPAHHHRLDPQKLKEPPCPAATARCDGLEREEERTWPQSNAHLKHCAKQFLFPPENHGREKGLKSGHQSIVRKWNLGHAALDLRTKSLHHEPLVIYPDP